MWVYRYCKYISYFSRLFSLSLVQHRHLLRVVLYFNYKLCIFYSLPVCYSLFMVLKADINMDDVHETSILEWNFFNTECRLLQEKYYFIRLNVANNSEIIFSCFFNMYMRRTCSSFGQFPHLNVVLVIQHSSVKAICTKIP